MKISYGNWIAKPETQRNDKMCNLFCEVADLADDNEEDYNMVMGILNDLKVKLTQSKVDCERKGDDMKLVEKTSDDEKLSENGCKILDPLSARSKGRPPVNRKQSTTEQIIRRRKESEAAKACNDKYKLQVRLHVFFL